MEKEGKIMSEEKKKLTDEELNKFAGGTGSSDYVKKICSVANTSDFSYFNGSALSDINTHLNACVKPSTGLEEGDVFYFKNQYFLVVKVLDSFPNNMLDKYDILVPLQAPIGGKRVEVTMWFAK